MKTPNEAPPDRQPPWSVALTAFLWTLALAQLNATEITVQQLKRFTVREAHQAVAVDETSFYAIGSRSIARYEKATAKPQAKWAAPEDSPIRHLNSGLILDGRLYCANSNWPAAPTRVFLVR